jgi:pSer/pThr/pTyr-binding forkhead associated (FHA) protein
MTNKPTIMVQLVHIKGPLQGTIQEFFESEIVIGRHPSCHIQFPKDLAVVSRKHARIRREGNRFKLIDQSSNGTFLNGKRIQEAFLKDGDVLIFTDGGPKVSFLTQVVDEQREHAFHLPVKSSTESVPEKPTSMAIAKSPPPSDLVPSPTQELPLQPAMEQSFEKNKLPLIIQYGATLRSFNDLPIKIGRNPSCDFILDHPDVLEQHAQIFYDQSEFWVKDLTGQNRVIINGQPIRLQAPLKPENCLSLSSQGPSFRFLGAGRLVEIQENVPNRQLRDSDKSETKPTSEISSPATNKKAGGKLKKFFRR